MATTDVIADQIPWDHAPKSGRDRSLLGRLERAIEAGTDDLEPRSFHLAAAKAWLDDDDRGDFREILSDLALLDALAYEELRKPIAEAAGIRVSALDVARADLLPQDVAAEAHQGTAPVLAEVEPWPEAVDGGELIDELVNVVAKFVALPDGAATAIALWIIFAHAHEAVGVSPLLALISPTKRCGKTTLLSLLSATVPRPLPASNISAAALFRAVEKFRPTLLVDEADTFLRDRDELRGILNAGHTRATAFVIRCDGEDHDARLFSTWAPKAIALIGDLKDTLEDRAVVVQMRRRTAGEAIERLRYDALGSFEPLRRRAARWAADNLDVLRKSDPAEIPNVLNDRASDNWRPLLAIADAAGGSWPENARKSAKVLAKNHDDDDGAAGVLLLGDVRTVFDDLNAERISSAGMTLKLAEMEERPWPEWGRTRKPITARGVARLLKPFGIKPRQMKIGGENVRGYEIADLRETFARYLAPVPLSPPATSLPGVPARGLGGSASATGEEEVADRDLRKPATVPDGSGVAGGGSAAPGWKADL